MPEPGGIPASPNRSGLRWTFDRLARRQGDFGLSASDFDPIAALGPYRPGFDRDTLGFYSAGPATLEPGGAHALNRRLNRVRRVANAPDERLLGDGFGSLEGSSVGIDLDIDRHLDDSAIGGGFLPPLTDHPASVVERHPGCSGGSLGYTHDRSDRIPPHSPDRGSNRLADGRTGLSRVGQSGAIGV